MRVLVRFTAVMLLALGTPTAVASAANARTAPLRGTNWVLTDRSAFGAPLGAVTVTAIFGARRVEGSSGCNGYSSSYTVRGSRMTIHDDGVSTQMACGDPTDRVERRYRDALTRVGRYRIDGTTLGLSTRTGRRLLVYRASARQ